MITIETIQSADYSTLVGLVRERNRPSGGIQTIGDFVNKAFIHPGKKVLEVGCNTGFSIVNIAAFSDAYCVGIDINADSLQEASEYAKAMAVSERVQFVQANALNIPFPDNHFDTVWVSNVTSFINDKSNAIKEYIRVLKPNGIIGFAPIYYLSTPPEQLRTDVENLIATKIDILSLDDWRMQIKTTSAKQSIELLEYSSTHYRYYNQENRIDAWIKEVLDKPHLTMLSSEVKSALETKYGSCMQVFNENLRYCGFSLLLYQKRLFKDETELFTTYLQESSSPKNEPRPIV